MGLLSYAASVFVVVGRIFSPQTTLVSDPLWLHSKDC